MIPVVYNYSPDASDWADLTPPTPRESAIATLRREAASEPDQTRCLQLVNIADALAGNWWLTAPAIALHELIEHYRRRDMDRALRLAAVAEVVERERAKEAKP